MVPLFTKSLDQGLHFNFSRGTLQQELKFYENVLIPNRGEDLFWVLIKFGGKTPSKLRRRSFFFIFSRIRYQNLNCCHSPNAFGVSNWIEFVVVQEGVHVNNTRCLSGTRS